METYRRICFAAVVLLAAGCAKVAENVVPEGEKTVLTVGLEEAKTVMGEASQGVRNVYWTDGDRLSLNGTASEPLSGVGEEQASAVFTFPGVLNPPYKLLYPSSFYKNENTITLPSTQSYVAGSFAPDTAPLAGYAASGSGTLSLGHLCAMVQLQVRKGTEAGRIAYVKFSGKDGEQVCGDFTIDYTVPSIAPAGEGEGTELRLTVEKTLPENGVLDLFIVVPPGVYQEGFSVVLADVDRGTMTMVKSGPVTLEVGKMKKMAAFDFEPGFGMLIDDIVEEVLEPEGFNVKGRVVDTDGNGLEHVVVSDGLQSVRTSFDGSFYLTSDIASTKFIQVSSPSGYMPPVENGLPVFYKLLSSITPVDGIYDCGDFVMTPVENPDRFTLIMTADPQPRRYESWNIDRIAFKSLDVCEDLYSELGDVAQTISGRQVYGFCLGDLVHESMPLFANYKNGLANVGFPTYNILGNHDHDPSAADDDAGAAPFESHFGPCNYSLNIGKFHFVVLDDLIMKKNTENDRLTSFDHGLTDRIWAWLQSDMAFVPTSTKIMVLAHSAMFKQDNGNERTNTAKHGGHTNQSEGGAYGYGDLFDKYTEVHAWAGHSHIGFNYIYPSSHRHKRVQVHTLARSTGELWTNEYLAAGTPRGFTIVEVDGDDISWRFHPTKYQTAQFIGVSSGQTSSVPSFTWRDWDYNASGIAVMKGSNNVALDETYQMHVYPKGAYGDDYVYANIFLWDSKWQNPVFTQDGGSPVEMAWLHSVDDTEPRIQDAEKVHDLADTEMRTFYVNNSPLMGAVDYTASDVGVRTTLFRAPATGAHGSGTVTVTDRFGNTYSRTVSW